MNNNLEKIAETAIHMQMAYLKKVMKDRGYTQASLAAVIEVDRTTLQRNFSGATQMLYITFLKICSVLEIRPYLIPAEMDTNKMQHVKVTSNTDTDLSAFTQDLETLE